VSDATDWIGAIGGIMGGATALWNMGAASKADAAKKQADAAKLQADAAKTQAAKATADATSAIAKAEDAQTKAQIGWLELQLRVYISSRRDKIHETTRDLESISAGRSHAQLSAEEQAHAGAIKLRWISAHEDFLCAMEQACRHFRDAKIDKEAFRLMYEDEIATLTKDAEEGIPFYAFMYPREKSRFHAVWAVADAWFKKE
jgi:hypothetical protein